MLNKSMAYNIYLLNLLNETSDNKVGVWAIN